MSLSARLARWLFITLWHLFIVGIRMFTLNVKRKGKNVVYEDQKGRKCKCGHNSRIKGMCLNCYALMKLRHHDLWLFGCWAKRHLDVD